MFSPVWLFSILHYISFLYCDINIVLHHRLSVWKMLCAKVTLPGGDRWTADAQYSSQPLAEASVGLVSNFTGFTASTHAHQLPNDKEESRWPAGLCHPEWSKLVVLPRRHGWHSFCFYTGQHVLSQVWVSVEEMMQTETGCSAAMWSWVSSLWHCFGFFRPVLDLIYWSIYEVIKRKFICM